MPSRSTRKAILPLDRVVTTQPRTVTGFAHVLVQLVDIDRRHLRDALAMVGGLN